MAAQSKKAKPMYRIALDSAEERMRSRIKEIRSILPHSGEIGGQIEHVFKSELRHVLPARVGITSGFVADLYGAISRQLDVILYDVQNTPSIFTGSGVQIVPVESTYAAGEIKTNLTRAELRDSFDKCKSYKDLKREAFFTPRERDAISRVFYLYGEESPVWMSLFFVLAMDGLSHDILARAAVEECGERRLNHRNKVDCIACLSGPMMVNARVRSDGTPDEGITFEGQPEQSWVGYPARSPWALFVKLLLVPMAQAPGLIVNLNAYPDGEPF